MLQYLSQIEMIFFSIWLESGVLSYIVVIIFRCTFFIFIFHYWLFFCFRENFTIEIYREQPYYTIFSARLEKSDFGFIVRTHGTIFQELLLLISLKLHNRKFSTTPIEWSLLLILILISFVILFNESDHVKPDLNDFCFMCRSKTFIISK